MNEKEYKEKIPHFCTFPHFGDICWSISYGYSERIGNCRSCEYSIMSKIKRKFLDNHDIMKRKREYLW